MSVSPASSDEYGVHHLSYHLSQASLSDELYHLVLDKRWYQQSVGFDPSGSQYSEDIVWASQATVEQIDTKQLKNDVVLGSLLARPAALAWLSASFGQTARLLAIPVLEAMTRMGNVSQATRRAAMIPDPVRRAEAFIQIGVAAFTLNKVSTARERWSQAQEWLLNTPTDLFNEKLETLGQLIFTLAWAGQGEESSSLAARLQAEVEDELDQTGGITSASYIALARAWGATGEKEKALTAVHSLTGAREKIIALCAAVEGLLHIDQAQASEAIDIALNLAAETDDKAALSKLAIRLAEANRLSDAWQVVKNTNDIGVRTRILLAAANKALQKGDSAIGESLLTEAIETSTAAQSRDRLLLLAEIAFIGHLVTNKTIITNLLNLLKNDWQEMATELDSHALGVISLGFIVLGEIPEAEAAISSALIVKMPNDDWEENDALGTLADKLGLVGDNEGLVWILTRARERQTAWQQAELAYRIANAVTEAGENTLAREARQLMKAAARGETRALPGENACGILAVWHAKKQDMVAARQLIEQAITRLTADPDSADALSYLALTLAHGQVKDLASYVLQKALDVLHQEVDPGTLARATGTAAEVAAVLEDMKTLLSLKAVAKEIDDDWLRAEALFWIAGWQALMAYYGEARQTYVEAAVSGSWQPLDSTDIEIALNRETLDWIVVTAEDVGWPSTTAAAIFAGLALAMASPKQSWIEEGLLAIGQITEGYNHIRAICHRLLLKEATQLSKQPDTAIKYWENALEYNHDRDIGETWAVIDACLPILYNQFGQPFVTSLWQELAKARNILLA